MRRSGGRVRTVAQLIDADTGNHIWAERYDRDLADLFAVQDEITSAVAHAIESAISHAERQRAIRKAPQNLSAWEAYQRGLWHWAKHMPADIERAQQFFRRASELDPLFAAPHAMLALYYQHIYGAVVRVDYETAVTEAKKAIELDPDDATALAVAAWMPTVHGHHEAAVQLADHAISTNPNDFGAYLAKARALALGGHPAEAGEPLLTALRLSPRDPLRVFALNTLVVAHYLSGNYADAVKVAQTALRDHPAYPNAHRWLAASLGQLNRTDEAQEALR